jgi:hypothetical protein
VSRMALMALQIKFTSHSMYTEHFKLYYVVYLTDTESHHCRLWARRSAAVGSGSRGSRSPRRLACFAACAHHGAQLASRLALTMALSLLCGSARSSPGGAYLRRGN